MRTGKRKTPLFGGKQAGGRDCKRQLVVQSTQEAQTRRGFARPELYFDTKKTDIFAGWLGLYRRPGTRVFRYLRDFLYVFAWVWQCRAFFWSRRLAIQNQQATGFHYIYQTCCERFKRDDRGRTKAEVSSINPLSPLTSSASNSNTIHNAFDNRRFRCFRWRHFNCLGQLCYLHREWTALCWRTRKAVRALRGVL
jgi:hypothetical protein